MPHDLPTPIPPDEPNPDRDPRPTPRAARRRVLPAVLAAALLLAAVGIYACTPAGAQRRTPTAPGGDPAQTPGVTLPTFSAAPGPLQEDGPSRRADLHTYRPDRPYFEIYRYTVQSGDTLFDIATKFGLHPETILWGNEYALGDSPDAIYAGQELNILPVDGAYYQWHTGDGLNGVARYFGVAPDDIVDYPGNHLDKETLGDYAAPAIPAGTWLIIPGGRREFVDWAAFVTREDPSTGSSMGTGACTAPISGGAVGSGTYIWPAPVHALSGYDYTPAINHWGIDIGGKAGDSIWAVDNGVVVFAGWSNRGYGNLVIIDHGDGVLSYYGHLSQVNVSCGQNVYQTNLIGLMGSTGRSTGPHLHFEMRHGAYGHLDPWSYLPR